MLQNEKHSIKSPKKKKIENHVCVCVGIKYACVCMCYSSCVRKG